MNFGEFLHLHPENIKILTRKIENLENKLANARVAIVFNKTCLNENLLPTFTNIYIYIYIYIYMNVNATIGIPIAMHLQNSSYLYIF